MKIRLWLKGLCVISLICGPVFASEGDPEENLHVPVGERAVAQEQLAFEQGRNSEFSAAIEKNISGKNTNNEPSAMMAEARKCLEENNVAEDLFTDEEKSKELNEKATYYTSHSGALHWVVAVTLPYGDPVQLEDGSVWTLYSGDDYKTLNWLTTDNILILPNRNTVWNSLYPYCLLNQQTGVSVQATASKGPWSNGSYARWIYSIDYYNCQLCLNDGSVWDVPFSDSSYLSGFLPGDYVIMGFNDYPGNGLGVNILINFSTMQYVYSTCILK